jgi:hypothetical protein
VIAAGAIYQTNGQSASLERDVSFRNHNVLPIRLCGLRLSQYWVHRCIISVAQGNLPGMHPEAQFEEICIGRPARNLLGLPHRFRARLF